MCEPSSQTRATKNGTPQNDLKVPTRAHAAAFMGVSTDESPGSSPDDAWQSQVQRESVLQTVPEWTERYPLALALLGVGIIGAACEATLLRVAGKGCVVLLPYALGYRLHGTLVILGILLCAWMIWLGSPAAIDISEALVSAGLGLIGQGIYVQAKNLTRLRQEDLEVVRYRAQTLLSTRFCVIAARVAFDSLYLWTSAQKSDFLKAVNDAHLLQDSLKATHAAGTRTLNEHQRAQFAAFLSTVVQAHRRQWADGRSNPVGLFVEKQIETAQQAVEQQVKETWLRWRSSVVSTGSKYCPRLPEYVEPRSAKELFFLLLLHSWGQMYYSSTEVRLIQVGFPLLAWWRYIVNHVNSWNFDRRKLRRALHFCRLNYVCHFTDSVLPALQPKSWRELGRSLVGFALYLLLQKNRWHYLLPELLRQSAILNILRLIYVPSYLTCRWVLNAASVQPSEWRTRSGRGEPMPHPKTLLDHRFSPVRDPTSSSSYASLPVRGSTATIGECGRGKPPRKRIPTSPHSSDRAS
eukprot:GEMP01023830.1.p1 GENE.GEMP01023830.1~~GEMP01023830.1.p1  ORF type:complete len:522 (+),score=90.17 GEMP01023830.1:318-1883(+)